MKDYSQLLAAVTLTEEGKYLEALTTFEGLRESADNVSERCILLLNEEKCLEALGRFTDARARLHSIQEIDTTGQFIFHVELAEIHIEFAEGKRDHALTSLASFVSRYSDKLLEVENQDIAYDLSLRMACELVSAARFPEGLAALTKFLPVAREKDLPRIHLFLGLAYEFSGSPDKAADEFHYVIRSDGEDDLVARANYDLGIQELNSDDLDLAKKHLLAAEALKSRLNIPLRELYMALADTFARLEQPGERDKYRLLAHSI